MIESQPSQQHIRHAELVSASIVHNILLNGWKTKIDRQVNPMRVIAFNQINFPLSMPVFQLFLAQNSPLNISKQFKANQIVYRIFFSKAIRYFAAMLVHTAHQIRRHSDINRAVMTACQYIDARLFFHKPEHDVKWMLKQVQHDDWVHSGDSMHNNGAPK